MIRFVFELAPWLKLWAHTVTQFMGVAEGQNQTKYVHLYGSQAKYDRISLPVKTASAGQRTGHTQLWCRSPAGA